MVRSTVMVAWVFAALVGCQKAEPMESEGKSGSAAELHVEVFYQERMMLPPTATVEVVLEDGAKMDVAAELIAKETVPAKSGPPYHVTLKYDPSTLSPKGRFGIRARIEDQGRLMFTSTEFIPAFGTQGSRDEPPNDPVQVLLRRAAGSGSAPSMSITGTRWVLQKLYGKPAGLGAGGRAAEITLQGPEPQMSGFAGCNQISGGYTLQGNQLSFGHVAMTLRACAEGEELERAFTKALGETKSYEVADGVLRLRDEAGTLVAELGTE